MTARRKPDPANPFADKSDAELRATLKAARRQLAIKAAHDDLIAFVKLTMPSPEDPFDSDLSLYTVMPHHMLIAEALTRVEAARALRMALAIPPQHGKSLLALTFIAWFIGRNWRKNIIFGTYNDDMAQRTGAKVRDIITSKVFREVFPGVVLDKRTRAKDAMKIQGGGEMNFVGRGGSGTGLPADLIIIDDPLKNADEAGSAAIIEDLHEWFTKVIRSRMRNTTRLVIIHTRWIEDDLIGRQCDPEHPNYDAGRAARYVHINVPAVVTDKRLADAMGLTLEWPDSPEVIEAFGSKPMAALWPREFSLEHLAQAKQDDTRAFEALYMGRPAPEDGEYFKKEWLVPYNRKDLPKNLRYYAASDHAVTEKQHNDPNVLGVVGIDENDEIWIMPDLVWERMQTDRTVEEMISLMRRYHPAIWWAENDHIHKSMGPFLRKRMSEEKVYTYVEPVTPHRDKQARARSIQGRMSMQKVHFPIFAPWYEKAKAELLKFPYATHDDFVDWLAWIGVGLDREIKAAKSAPRLGIVHPTGSIEWILAQSKMKAANDRGKKAARSW